MPPLQARVPVSTVACPFVCDCLQARHQPQLLYVGNCVSISLLAELAHEAQTDVYWTNETMLHLRTAPSRWQGHKLWQLRRGVKCGVSHILRSS